MDLLSRKVSPIIVLTKLSLEAPPEEACAEDMVVALEALE